MKASVKRQWIEDLRSGNFLQGKSKLWYQEGIDGPKRYCGRKLWYQEEADGPKRYCCLWVLGERQCPDAREGESVTSRLDRLKESLGGVLSYRTLKKLGLDHEDQRHLARMNDEGDDFKTIADWIEANVSEEADDE